MAMWLVATGALVACEDRDGPATARASTATKAPAPLTSPGASPPSSAARQSPVISPSSAAPPLPSAQPSPTASEASRPLHLTSQDALLALLPTHAPSAEPFLRKSIDVGGPFAMNQGNASIAKHERTRSQCLAGLDGLTLQTAAQRAQCGHDNMVPIYRKGDAASAHSCIDIFEFPNQACTLPFVWASPTIAHATCQKLGKRLCSQDEWMLACEGAPDDAAPQRYGYGDKLDLGVCNTNKPASEHNEAPCDATSARSAWKTCGTHTEPSGAFPGCRSRLGVFDLQGNVAEGMKRRDPDGKTYSQLKGSAFFYVDVHRPEGGERKRENYPDHCRHNPRWHVESMRRAWHVNYHLGFRCCVSLGGK